MKVRDPDPATDSTADICGQDQQRITILQRRRKVYEKASPVEIRQKAGAQPPRLKTMPRKLRKSHREDAERIIEPGGFKLDRRTRVLVDGRRAEESAGEFSISVGASF